MSKKKTKQPLKWEEIYELPLHLDKYGPYAWSVNDTMALMFDKREKIGPDERAKILASINDSAISEYENITIRNATDFYEGERYLFCVRGWGNLIGIGALNLPEEEAAKIQDGFVAYILEKLRNKKASS